MVNDLAARLNDGADRFLKWAHKQEYSGPPVLSIPAHPGNVDCLMAEAAACIEALETKNAALRDAIRPFVEYVHDDLRDGDHRYKFVRTVELGGGWIAAEDLRRALRALEEEAKR